MINTFIIPTTAWMRMAITNILLVDAEASRITVEEVRMFTGNTVWSSRGGGLAAILATMGVRDLGIVLLGKPVMHIALTTDFWAIDHHVVRICLTITNNCPAITVFVLVLTVLVKIATVSPLPPVNVTRAPECFIRIKELLIELLAGCVYGKHLVR